MKYTPFANDTAILNDWNLGFNSDANLISAVSLAKRVYLYFLIRFSASFD
jgi:hypothetical protein